MSAAAESAPIALRCACGTVRGAFVTSAEPGTHGRCYCNDCRAAARWFGRDDLLDAYGGTEVVQTWPARVTLTAGTEQLRLLRLSPKGLFRWYAGCCRTPLLNSFGPGRAPFVGLLVAFVAPDDRPRLDALFGPAHGVQGRFAPGGVPPGAHASAPFGVLRAAAGMLLRGAWAGAHTPHPCFPAGGAEGPPTTVLTPEERAALG